MFYNAQTFLKESDRFIEHWNETISYCAVCIQTAIKSDFRCISLKIILGYAQNINPYDFGVAAVGSDLVIPFECPPLIVREEIFCNVTIKEKNGLYGPAPLHKPVLLGLARCSTVKNENYLILSIT